MIYSDFYLKSQKRFLVPLLTLAVISVVSFSFFFLNFGSAPTRASKKVLKRHEIANLSTNHSAIFWESAKKESGWVIYGEGESVINIIALDERDIESKKNESYFHYVQLKNLEKDKVYYYKIVSGNEVVTGVNGVPFQFKTTKNNNITTTIKPSYGKVALPNGQPSQNSLILLYYPGAYPLITLAKTTGEWLIPLQLIIERANNDMISVKEEEIVTVEILTDDYPITSINIPVKNTNPFSQTITIGKEYIIQNEEKVLAAATTNTIQNIEKIQIIIPREGSVIPSVKPLLKGLALPLRNVSLFINSEPEFSQKIMANNKGEWKLEMPIAMAAGNYILTVKTEGENKKEVTLMRNFTVAKSGEQVLGQATGEAALTPTMVPTSPASPSPSVTSLPNTSLSPTSTSTPPVSGLDSKIFVYMSAAFIVLGAGFLLIF